MSLLSVLQQRIRSAIGMLCILIAIVWWLPVTWHVVWVGLLLSVALVEWLRMMTLSWPTIMAVVTVFCVSFVMVHAQWFWPLLWLNIVVVGVGLVGFYLQPHRLQVGWPKWLECGHGVLCLILLGQAFCGLWALHAGLLLLCMGLVWVTDSMAYFVGRSFGRTHCFVPMSPNKTLEGAVAGVLAAVLLAGLSWPVWQIWAPVSLVQAMVFGLSAGVACVIGDLWESAIKRRHHAKDSGQWIPGHGGLLDRIDGMMLALPCVWGLWSWV